MNSVASDKVTTGGTVALIVGAIAQALANEGLTIEQAIAILITAAVSAGVAWWRRERNPSTSAREVIEAEIRDEVEAKVRRELITAQRAEDDQL